ncbi:hypothetical protein [Streptomyces sp. NPDC006477]|uniref:hypothetical protein n=1 Tax=Streptomyces sp. NPDC006477 TaxID=3364747 RepID=UPI0036AA7440
MNDQNPGLGFFNLVQHLSSLAEAETLVNILCVNDGVCENMLIRGYDKGPDAPVIYAVDEDGDSTLIFVHQIISITPVTEDTEEEEVEDGEVDFPEFEVGDDDES